MPLMTSVARRGIEPAAGEVVEEKQRLSALHQDIVDTHGHEIDADGVMALELFCQQQLGADAVGAGDQYGLFVATGRQGEKTAKATQAGEHLRSQLCAGSAA